MGGKMYISCWQVTSEVWILKLKKRERIHLIGEWFMFWYNVLQMYDIFERL